MAPTLLRTCLVLPLIALSLASPNPRRPRSTLPLCSDIIQPCSCPAGATFVNTTTYATIGATASDIGAVTNNCMIRQQWYRTCMLTRRRSVFNTSWFDLDLISTTGVYNEYGATRTISAGGDVTLTEKVCYAVAQDILGSRRLFLTALAHRGSSVWRRVVHSTL